MIFVRLSIEGIKSFMTSHQSKNRMDFQSHQGFELMKVLVEVKRENRQNIKELTKNIQFQNLKMLKKKIELERKKTNNEPNQYHIKNNVFPIKKIYSNTQFNQMRKCNYISKQKIQEKSCSNKTSFQCLLKHLKVLQKRIGIQNNSCMNQQQRLSNQNIRLCQPLQNQPKDY
ncbi:unnamed protein product [Paramecium sonneborni]|uniref:Uncharacterized protein n=1 Tax=Paramecium sonneborni TaxID=65129 RepID=A0A8S1PTF9_9CILI|nr:unnamed protein product [Paramecium sonneborni]